MNSKLPAASFTSDSQISASPIRKMTDSTPSSNINRAFSFSKDIKLSLSRQPSQSGESHVPENVGNKESGRIFETNLGNGSMNGEGGVVESSYAIHEELSSGHFLPDNDSVSEHNGSSRSSIPYVESSHMTQEQSGNDDHSDSRYDTYRRPTDFELFLAKSRAEYERDRERYWPKVEIDGESFVNKETEVTHRKGRNVTVLLRNTSRVLQLLVSAFVLILTSVTIATVRETVAVTQGNDENLWPNPLVLWPECLAITISILSFLLSLLVAIGIFFVERLSEKKSNLGFYINFGVNMVLLILWTVATILVKVFSSNNFIWGYSCSLSSRTNAFVRFAIVCGRETTTWGFIITASALELVIFITYFITFRRYRAIKAEREEAWRISEMRKSVHRTMTGNKRLRPTTRKHQKGWEAGTDGTSTPRINVIPAEDD